MLFTDVWPRAPILAVSFGAGIWLGEMLPGRAASPILVLAMLAWVAAVRQQTPVFGRFRLLAIVVLVGVLRVGLAPPAGTPGAGECAKPDDRADDVVTGLVRGPIEDGLGVRRFVVATRAATAVLVSARGDRLPPVLPGDRVQVVGRLRTPRGYRVPGGIDWTLWLRGRGAQLSLSARAENVHIVDAGARPSLWRWPAVVQRRAGQRIAERGGSATGKAVVRAMVLGDRGGLDEATTIAFRDAGTSHVLAVSGLHLAVVALVLFGVVRRACAWLPGGWVVWPNRVAAVVAGLGALGFALVTGGRISTVRALIVAVLVLAALATARRVRLIDLLGVAALLLLALEPHSLFDPAFQLSFAATTTLAIAFGGGRQRLPRWWQRALRYPIELAHAALWAGLATAPFTALTFHSFAPAGFVANVVVVPLAELLVLPIGLLGVALGALWPAAGGVCLDVAITVAAATVDVAAWFGRVVPPSRVPAPRWWELLSLAVVWGAALAWRRRVLARSTCAWLAAAGLVAVVASYVITTRIEPRLRTHLRVVFLDVGQGDGAVLELPGGATWLVDAGGHPFVIPRPGESAAERIERGAEPGRMSVLRYLMHRRVRRLELVILSHPHPDHYLGLFAVAQAVPIDELWVARPPPDEPPNGAYAELLQLLRRRGTRIVHPPLGLARTERGVAVRVLHPRYRPGVASADPIHHANDNSITVLVEFAGRRLLLAGDVERDAERALVDRHGSGLRADVIKVPHHGSPTSSTAAFVDAVRPDYAIISCGVANRFDFPSAGVVARWRGAGAQVLRTDQAGAITVDIAPSGRLRVSTYDQRPCAQARD